MEMDDLETGYTVGTCDKMCPGPEIQERVGAKQVHRYEMLEDDPNDTSLLIKRYCRIVDTSNNAPQFFRTRMGIARSMDRLRQVMDMEDESFPMRAAFIEDRYRGIWKDMQVQNWSDEFRVMVLEEIARFMIYADFVSHDQQENEGETSNNKSASLFADKYDLDLGIQLLNQVLVTLGALYQSLRQEAEPWPNEAEFRGYQLLLHATPVEGRQINHLEYLRAYKTCPEDLLADVEDIVELQEAFNLKYWRKFFGIFKKLDFFKAALASRMLPYVRHHALNALMKSKNPRAVPMPIDEFCRHLMLAPWGAEHICRAYGIPIIMLRNGKPGIDIKAGLQRNTGVRPPRLGCDLPPWNILEDDENHRDYNLSTFICQHVTGCATMLEDFTQGMSAYPSWSEMLEASEGIGEENDCVLGDAIRLYMDKEQADLWIVALHGLRDKIIVYEQEEVEEQERKQQEQKDDVESDLENSEEEGEVVDGQNEGADQVADAHPKHSDNNRPDQVQPSFQSDPGPSSYTEPLGSPQTSPPRADTQPQAQPTLPFGFQPAVTFCQSQAEDAMEVSAPRSDMQSAQFGAPGPGQSSGTQPQFGMPAAQFGVPQRDQFSAPSPQPQFGAPPGQSSGSQPQFGMPTAQFGGSQPQFGQSQPQPDQLNGSQPQFGMPAAQFGVPVTGFQPPAVSPPMSQAPGSPVRAPVQAVDPGSPMECSMAVLGPASAGSSPQSQRIVGRVAAGGGGASGSGAQNDPTVNANQVGQVDQIGQTDRTDQVRKTDQLNGVVDQSKDDLQPQPEVAVAVDTETEPKTPRAAQVEEETEAVEDVVDAGEKEEGEGNGDMGAIRPSVRRRLFLDTAEKGGSPVRLGIHEKVESPETAKKRKEAAERLAKEQKELEEKRAEEELDRRDKIEAGRMLETCGVELRKLYFKRWMGKALKAMQEEKMQERRDAVFGFMRNIPEDYQIAPDHIGKLWDLSIPWEEPPIVPRYFPPRLYDTHVIDGIAENESCAPLDVAKVVCREMLRKNQHTQYLTYKVIFLSHWDETDESEASIPGVWAARRLQGAVKGPWLDSKRMKAKGRVLTDHQTHRIVENQRSGTRKAYFNTVVWQPNVDQLDQADQDLFKNTSGILVLVNDLHDVEPSLNRLRSTLKAMPRPDPFPPIVLLSCFVDDNSDYLRKRCQDVIQECGIELQKQLEVKVFQIAPYLLHVRDHIFESYYKYWGRYFQSRGHNVVIPDVMRYKEPPTEEPMQAALYYIARASPTLPFFERQIREEVKEDKKRWREETQRFYERKALERAQETGQVGGEVENFDARKLGLLDHVPYDMSDLMGDGLLDESSIFPASKRHHEESTAGPSCANTAIVECGNVGRERKSVCEGGEVNTGFKFSSLIENDPFLQRIERIGRMAKRLKSV